MPENNLSESGQAGGASQASGVSQSDASSTSFDPLATFNSLKGLPEFQAFVEQTAVRQAQSVKDKRIQKIEKKQDGFTEQLARFRKLTEGGLSEDVALEFMGLTRGEQQQVSEEDEAVSQQAPAPQKPEGQQGFNYQSVLSAMGLNLADVKVAKVLSDFPDDLSAQLSAFAGIAAGSAQAGTKASAASILPLETSGKAPSGEIQAQYEAAVAKVAQGDINHLLQVKDEFRKKGLDIL